MSTTLKRRIQSLERQGGSAREAQIRKQQVSAALTSFFFLGGIICSNLRGLVWQSTDRISQVEIR